MQAAVHSHRRKLRSYPVSTADSGSLIGVLLFDGIAQPHMGGLLTFVRCSSGACRVPSHLADQQLTYHHTFGVTVILLCSRVVRLVCRATPEPWQVRTHVCVCAR